MVETTRIITSLPLTISAVKADWLTAALRTTVPDIVVTGSEVETVIFGTSTKIRVRLESSSEAVPRTVIVKGGFEAHSPTMAAMYANEARFYADIAPFLPMPVPRCYFAGSDPSSHQSIVILEDLKRPGLRFCDPLVPENFDAIAARLCVMAAYHAETWDSPHFETGGRWSDIGSRFDGWGLDYMQHYLQSDIWDHHVHLPRGEALAPAFKDRTWMAAALAHLGDIQRRQPKCLIHGDTHLGNLYVAEDGTPGFFDAQVARTAWHHEVAYHIICAADRADRGAWEEELLRHYLDALAQAGGPVLDYDAAWLDYRRAILWGLFIFLINEVRFQSEAVNLAYTERFGQAALDHDLHRLLP